MVSAINEMGHALGKRTVAEFVENEEIRQHLLSLGVDFVQGFGIARPKPIDEVFGLTTVGIADSSMNQPDAT